MEYDTKQHELTAKDMQPAMDALISQGEECGNVTMFAVTELAAMRVALASMFRFITSADSRLAASSKVVRVRVLGSKNRLATVRPTSDWLRAGSSPGAVR